MVSNKSIYNKLINKLFSLVALATLCNWHLKKKKKKKNKNCPRYSKIKVKVSLVTEVTERK